MKTSDKLVKLIDLKSIVTFLLTLTLSICIVISLIQTKEINKELLVLFSTSYSSIITYFFTRKNKEEVKNEISS